MLRVSKSVKNVNNYQFVQITVFFILSTSHVLPSLKVVFLYSILL